MNTHVSVEVNGTVYETKVVTTEEEQYGDAVAN